MNFPTTKEARERIRSPKKDKWKSKIYFISFVLFVIQIVHPCNMFFGFLVFFRSDVSSMFASAEEVQHFYDIIVFFLRFICWPPPLRIVTVKIPKVLTAMTKQKKKKKLFLTLNPLMQMRKKSFVSGTNAAFH